MSFFFFNDTATTEIYTLSLHDALPISLAGRERLGNPSDPPSFATLALVELAYAWRFLPSAEAVRRTDGLVRQAKRVGVTQLDAGARYLGASGVPQGGPAFAELLLHEPAFARSASPAP